MIKFSPRPYQDLIINHKIDILSRNNWSGMGKADRLKDRGVCCERGIVICALRITLLSNLGYRPALHIPPRASNDVVGGRLENRKYSTLKLLFKQT